jgi:hypothetical protein
MSPLGTDLESILTRFFLDYYLPSLKNPCKALLISAAKFSALDCAVSRVVIIFILKILRGFHFCLHRFSYKLYGKLDTTQRRNSFSTRPNQWML